MMPFLSPDEQRRVEAEAQKQMGDPKTGISIRFIREYDVKADLRPSPLDAFALDPFLLTDSDRAFLAQLHISHE